MSLSNVQAQLGNILAAMPLKLQKVDAAFLDDSTPPFEGAVVSDEQGQFYIGDFNSNGDLFWKPIRDTISMSESSTSEAFVTYNLPVGFESSTISFGKTLTGDLVSVFVQIETPVAANILFYATTIDNIQKDKFDLFISDTIRTTGFKLHVFARAYANPDSDGDGVLDNEDAFPYDASETIDTDSDGIGDNADAFPDDPTESLDTDGDGVGDNTDPDVDGDGIPNESDADYSVTLSSTFSGVSFVTEAVGSGTNLLQVNDVSGLSLGDTIIIDEGTAQEEEAVIAGFGSLVLSSPLNQPHNIGATIRKKDTLSLISLPSGVIYNSDGSNIISISVDGIIFNAADGVYSNSTYAPHDFNGNSVPSSSLIQGFDTSYRTPGGSVLNLTFTRINGYLEVQSMSVGWSDVDGDGYGEHADAFPNDATENVDTDGDGVGDNSDAFPNNPSESSDSDSDGVGDNADDAPNDPGIQTDSDGDGIDDSVDPSFVDSDADGVVDELDDAPNDPGIQTDSDGDGIDDSVDPSFVDSDGDGVVDELDAFPNDPDEDTDTDSDGVGDNADDFPQDALRSWSEVEFSALGSEILLSANDLSASVGSVGAELLLSSSVDELMLFGFDTQVGVENVGPDPDEFNISSIISQIDIGDISSASSDSTTISSLSIQIVLEEV